MFNYKSFIVKNNRYLTLYIINIKHYKLTQVYHTCSKLKIINIECIVIGNIK